MEKKALEIQYLPIASLRPAEYNPRKHSREALEALKQSLSRFGAVDPIILNGAPDRMNVVIGGHMRLKALKELGEKTVPVVYVNLPDLEKEKELNIRLNKNTGEFDWDLLNNFSENFLKEVGFSSEELDDIFLIEENPETFDLKKELEKLDIKEINIKKGDVYDLDGSRLMCGDSTIETDMLKLMGNEKADMCFTDAPYRLDYLKGKKKNGKPVEGFGYKRDRKYLETDILPDDFTELWMGNIAKIASENFSIIAYENWKNVREVWGVMEKHWKVKNMIVWRVPNRVQNFSAKYKFFNKHDIAMVGASGDVPYNLEPEEEPLQNEYEIALYAIQGKPQWESYEKGKRICPTDFIEHVADDAKHSGQGIIFGTKPLPILIPYIKVLTKRNDLIVEPFGGSGSTLIASVTMKRRCYLMEKSPVYAEVIKRRWEKLTGKKAKLYVP